MGLISEEQVLKDKQFYNNYLQIWKRQLGEHKGPYLSILKNELDKKLKELISIRKTQESFVNRENYYYAVFFHIYYMARLYFDERNEKGLKYEHCGFIFVANIKTYCHTLTRHYFPSMNREIDTSINSDIPCIDINNFLESIKYLLDAYFKINPIFDTRKEFLLFIINGEKYILWIKYKNLNELSHNEGFEVCSFYKCEKDIDLNRFIGTKEVEFERGCICCVGI